MAHANTDPMSADDHPSAEPTDVQPSTVLWLCFGVVTVVAIAQVLLWLLLSGYRNAAQKRDPVLSPLADLDARPPGPQLQDAPMRDFQEFAAAEAKQLNSYGWVDREQGIVHIPINRAVDLIVERGIAPPESSTPQESNASPSSP